MSDRDARIEALENAWTVMLANCDSYHASMPSAQAVTATLRALLHELRATPSATEGAEWEQRAKDAEAALWCIHIHGYAPEDHFAMTCACATSTKAMLEKIARVAGQAPSAPACEHDGGKP